ncbi:hypothetical protein [Prevotella corporis]|uniref:hypothetical protein n=1 Tax=Prevotella corporis TaxID=28128 RepID=UPI0023F16285|nr:hypothetical protein [Prevotella corporis]
MKKLIILAVLLLGMAHSALAEQRGVFMQFHRRINPEDTRDVNRAPMHLPIEVVYDFGTHKIEVIGEETMDAKVFLYNGNGSLENCASSLNTEFAVLTPCIYIIQIQGNGWYAEGKIGME